MHIPRKWYGAEHRNIKIEIAVSGTEITVLRTFGGFMCLGFLQRLRGSAACFVTPAEIIGAEHPKSL